MAAGSPLLDALADARRLGFLGDRDLDEVVAHARVFTRALDDLAVAGEVATGQDHRLRIVDLGSGGGVPGLVLAADRPDWSLTLVDRRAKRTDFLERVVTRLGWAGRVEVVCSDVNELIQQRPAAYDAVVARGFGPPARTLMMASRLTRRGGRIVISDPPTGDRWDPDLLAELELRHADLLDDAGRVAVFDGFT